MSADYCSTTFALSPETFPSRFVSFVDLESFVEAKANEKYAEQKNILHESEIGDSSLVLHGASRYGAFQHAIADVLSTRGTTGLAFLTYGHFDQKFDSSHGGYFAISVLDSAKIVAAIVAIHDLIEWATLSPDELAKLLPGYEIMPDVKGIRRDELILATRQLVLDALRDDIISIHPSVYVPCADDGTGPGYFFAFLRTVLVILEGARKRGDIVVHFQSPAG
jgi:hypothetical protein